MSVRLLLGDCLERLAEVPAGSMDLVLADLPYGTTACAWDAVIPFAPLWAHLWRVCKPSAAVVLTAAQPFTSALGASALGELRYGWVWEKTQPTGHLNAKRMPMRSHEDILVFYRAQPTYNPQGVRACDKPSRGGHNGGCYGADAAAGRGRLTAENYPRSVLRFPRDPGGVHPTQKPVDLFRYLVRTYSNPRDTVLDCTMGSGTTGVACEIEGRHFVGIERDPAYFQTAEARIREALL